MEELVQDPKWTNTLEYWKAHSPSRSNGMSFKDELTGQAKGVQYITRVASHLRLPAQTIFTATLYLHRFYTKNSLTKIHPYQIAAACVFLACKTEETSRKLKDVAGFTTKVALKLEKDLKEIEAQHSKEVEQWIRVIPMREDELLQTLKFDFNDTAPYDTLNKLVTKHIPSESRGVVGPKALLFINDSCRTLLSLELTTKDLAVVSLFWALDHTKVVVPETDGKQWYEEYMSYSDIVQSINDMSEMMDIVRGSSSEGQKYERMS